MNLNGAELMIRFLEFAGVEIVSGIPGGASLSIYDALYESKIRHILTRHEQGAGFIAGGMARANGKPGVCFASSGPGVTNLITAVADAKMDSIPLIVITGQVPVSMIGTDAFQEIDTFSLSVPITKRSYLVKKIEDLIQILPQAWKTAIEGRPGPVWIDVPKDVASAKIDWDISREKEVWNIQKIEFKDTIDLEWKKTFKELLSKAKKPVFYIGGGLNRPLAAELFCILLEKLNFPTVSTLMGLGICPYEHPRFLGMLGMHGSRAANLVLEEADLLVALGVRFDDRATGKLNEFCPNAKIVHVDIDATEIGKLKNPNLFLKHGVENFITQILEEDLSSEHLSSEEWLNQVQTLKTLYGFSIPKENQILHPVSILQSISNILGEKAIITTDVGQHQMWVAQYYPFRKQGSFLTSGGLGTMGFGLPAAIGAALVFPEKRIVCISGDGSILMNIQELDTLRELNLDVTILLINNGHLGLVRQQQELFFSSRFSASKFVIPANFIKIASSFGIPSFELSNECSQVEILEQALIRKGPSFVLLQVEPDLQVLPMVPPGKANREMIY
ncbi:acetolactate synthase, large subunit, biosynthetic type [Leptospira interrogans str. 2003000735]|uniref:Acetolactate synthase n=1 Tax=Leptospira interrogans str. 2002000626 TaxID=996803 RepID=A0A829DE74_LEPIR|nr:biosynthetic-type acetolactate synthase large subunit [Leptospira interrogans]EMY07001.1 acetolactate synthase, large subunit, biosynthetic type [Leptospira interrogans str. 2002000626]EKN90628.1 acetolactate synthase, large subunit, biosynthetic type [Leptospira interrogans str. 2002000624]EKQ37643.1 acetolactate synthase, large subunit, biosynthetic type [Leptospira interrogans str. 2002000621]EKQ46993.1 acetolactate synthase, large subunit, biosynthetic type [Leptospira interrogans str. 2